VCLKNEEIEIEKENTTILIYKTGHPYEIVRKITLKYLLQKERFW
jgi:hypothetical protein